MTRINPDYEETFAAVKAHAAQLRRDATNRWINYLTKWVNNSENPCDRPDLFVDNNILIPAVGTNQHILLYSTTFKMTLLSLVVSLYQEVIATETCEQQLEASEH
jgi:hypothetical protein